MANSIKVFENSLRDYLISVKKDSYHSDEKIEYSYSNLKIYMEPSKNTIPHFWVSTGISAACYTINPVTAISGSMGQDDRYILLWANRPNINGELKKQWAYLVEIASVRPDENIDEEQNKKNKTKQKSKENNIQEASEIITGAGSSNLRERARTKNFERIVEK